MEDNNDPATIISLPTSNDVICGRGHLFNLFVGNRCFQSLIKERKMQYNWTTKIDDKNKFAKIVVGQVRASGGRFIKFIEEANDSSDSNSDTEGNLRLVWEELSDTAALAKCKQALREKKCPTEANVKVIQVPELIQKLQQRVRSKKKRRRQQQQQKEEEEKSSRDNSNYDHASSASTVVSEDFTAAGDDPTSTANYCSSVDNSSCSAAPNATSGSVGGGNATTGSSGKRPFSSNNTEGGISQDFLDLMSPSLSSGNILSPGSSSSCEQVLERAKEEEEQSKNEAGEFLLTALRNKLDEPMITPEQEALERASMTDEERIAALSDVFGECCTVKPSKRGRRDLDRCSIDFLVKQMRFEIDVLPNESKLAMLEAQEKCHDYAYEFSDSRLEQFLRCERMNPKHGAQRFVKYWMYRREVFGPIKFTWRMTLSGALRDDWVALETGFCRLLPSVDVSGRQLLVFDHTLHTLEGYSSESMLRAYWYVMEVAAKENNHIDRGTVHILWDKNLTIWDFDFRVGRSFMKFDKECIPLKTVAWHACCAPALTIMLMKPLALAILDKERRSRVCCHDVPESEITDVLFSYGITRDMLPTFMGGALDFNQRKWMLERLAVEPKENGESTTPSSQQQGNAAILK